MPLYHPLLEVNGLKPSVYFSDKPISPDHTGQQFVVPRWCGGIGSFIGVVRDINHDRKVSHIEYELYAELAVNEINVIIQESTSKYALGAAHVAHRYGRIEVGEYAVIVQAAAKHRGQAIAGCKYIIDEIKQRLPIWKKEWYTDGSYDWPFCKEHHGAAL